MRHNYLLRFGDVSHKRKKKSFTYRSLERVSVLLRRISSIQYTDRCLGLRDIDQNFHSLLINQLLTDFKKESNSPGG